MSGIYDPAFGAQFGMVSYDWSNAKAIWANTKPMDCEAMLLKQVELTKAVNPDSKTWVYRNLVKALPWFGSVREKMDDPSYSGWFLKFSPAVLANHSAAHVPVCDKDYSPPKCTPFYHDQEQTPEHPHGDGSCVDKCDCGVHPCGEYLWNHANGSMLREFLVNEFVGGPKGVGSKLVDGLFLDDGWSNHSDPKPAWADPGYGQCDMGPKGGATVLISLAIFRSN